MTRMRNGAFDVAQCFKRGGAGLLSHVGDHIAKFAFGCQKDWKETLMFSSPST